MSKYIDEIHACEGNEEKTMTLLEKSVTKILLDIVLLSVLIFFYSGVLKSSAATISKTATISTEAVLGIYAVIYGGFAVFLYLLIRHMLPFIILGIPHCIILLFNAIKFRFFVKKQDEHPSISVEPGSQSAEDSQETYSEGEKAEQKIWDYLTQHKYKYIFGFAFLWLSNNGNLGGMSQDDFIEYIKQKTKCSVSPGTISNGLRIAGECSNHKCENKLKQKEYDNMAEVFNSLIKKNERLPGILKNSKNN